jgi:hypothetical protein
MQKKAEQSNGWTPKNWDKGQTRVEKIANLTFDMRFYPRKQVDRQLVKTYAQALKAGSKFPSLKVGLFDGDEIVVDGFHRAESRILLKIDYADCTFLPFLSEAELFAEAVWLNSGHGKNFTESELRANAKRLRRYKFEVKDIVTLVHIPAAEIERETTKSITTLTTPSGKKKTIENDDATVQEIIQGTDEEIKKTIKLKNALMLICRYTESGHVPDHPGIKALVTRVRAALEKLEFDP